MTLQNRDSSAFDRDDVFIVPDAELDDAELLLAEEEDLSKAAAVTSERMIDDKYNKTLDATQIYLNEIGSPHCLVRRRKYSSPVRR